MPAWHPVHPGWPMAAMLKQLHRPASSQRCARAGRASPASGLPSTTVPLLVPPPPLLPPPLLPPPLLPPPKSEGELVPVDAQAAMGTAIARAAAAALRDSERADRFGACDA